MGKRQQASNMTDFASVPISQTHLPSRLAPGGLEAGVASDAAVSGRTLQPGAGSFGADQPRRPEPPESGRAAVADRGVGTRGGPAPLLRGSPRRGEERAFRGCGYT